MALETISLRDFSGGINLDAHEFNLKHNEVPYMLNMEVDQRGGVRSRDRWYANTYAPITGIAGSRTASNWDPRHSHFALWSDGSAAAFFAEETGNDVWYWDDAVATWATIGSYTCDADPHVADFATWGDLVYVVCGTSNTSFSHSSYNAGPTTTTLTNPGVGTWNDDYTTPAGGYMPQASVIEAHAGYVFVGNLASYPNRIRWSHPNQPEDWAELDYIDIDLGGSKITALKSFHDHLLIFKENAVFALFGYDNDSWQLIPVSEVDGCLAPYAVTSSPSSVFFYSPNAGAIREYVTSIGVKEEEISRNIRPGLPFSGRNEVFLGWSGKRLWVSVRWDGDNPGATDPGTVFVYDPARPHWVMHRIGLTGKINGFIEGGGGYFGHFHALTDGSTGEATALEISEDYLATATTDTFIVVPNTAQDFDCAIRTDWIDAGTPEATKSWKRPRFIMGKRDTQTILDVDTYRDYDESAAAVSQTLTIPADADEDGARTLRTDSGGSLGWTEAVSVELSTNSANTDEYWRLLAIEMKFRRRKRTT